MGDLVDADSCPADPSVLPRCGVCKSGDMCLVVGTCGTSSEEGNCFMRRLRLQAAGDPFAVYHVITNSKKKKTSGSFPWWAIVLMCLMLVSAPRRRGARRRGRRRRRTWSLSLWRGHRLGARGRRRGGPPCSAPRPLRRRDAGGRRCSAWRTRRSSAGRRTSRLRITHNLV